MNTIDFQIDAQRELVESAMKLLARSGPSSLILKAPTGAGKTVMMANALADLSKACEGLHRLAILWVAPNKLHEQSHARLAAVYRKSKALECLFPEELSGTDIPEKAVLFLNWASIDSDKLVLRRDNETGRNLAAFINKAKAAGRKVLLVVDESHLHLDSGPQAKVVIDNIIRPDLLIEVSATPRNASPDKAVTVLREDVVAAGMIRKRIVVNPDMEVSSLGRELLIRYTGTSENLLDLALAKQAELTRLYRAEGSPVAPLVLVQLPSRNLDTTALERFEKHLGANHNLHRGKGLEVWLSDDRTDGLSEIASFGSTARVLFFKQGIATGWDCPRAQILVGLREMKSDTFTTQVLGRIIRQPQHMHYENDALNYGYAFTNYERLKLDTETASWMGKALVRAQNPFALPFPNWTPKHFDRRHHLNRAALEAMLRHTGKLNGVEHRGPVTVRLLAGVQIEDIDRTREEAGSFAVALDLKGLQDRLNSKKDDLVRELADQGSGRKYVEAAVRMSAFNITHSLDEQVQLETILHPMNWPHFEAMVREGIGDFKAGQEKAARTLVRRDEWMAPTVRFLDLSEPLDGYRHCLYKPVLEGQFEKSNVERPFTSWLDSQSKVDTWLKNGDSGREHFAIQYAHAGEMHLFYIDFLVRLTDGTIGLFDTKGAGKSELSTGNLRETTAKAEALYDYIEELKAQGHRVRGGIVIFKDGTWWLHDGREYPGTTDISVEKGWEYLTF